MDMSSRHNQLSQLETYLKDVDMEVTMILQSLQWDRKHLMAKSPMKVCQYDINHRVPPDKLEEHEKQCFLKSQGYTDQNRLLPSPFDQESETLVKFDSNKIVEIINNASRCEALFKTGAGCIGTQPLTLDRLQATYTADERRAIYDEVVKQVPSCHDLSDLAPPTSKDGESGHRRPKSKLEILAELRDMKRRRTKYRVAAKTRNYSDVLRDVISTQMEVYTKAQKNVVDPLKDETADGSGDVDLKRSNEEATLKHQNLINPSRTHDNNEENDSKRTHNRYNESQQSRHNKEYDGRKRKYDNTDRQRQDKYSKINESDRSRGCEIYYSKYIDNYPSHLTKRNYTESHKREDRYTDSSRINRDGRKGYDPDERRKIRSEKDSNNQKTTETESHVPASKDVKTEEYHSSQGVQKRSNKSGHRRDSKEKRQNYDGNSCNDRNRTLNSDQNKTQKTADHFEKRIAPINIKEILKKEKNDSHDDHDESYSSDDNRTDYTETSSSYSRAKDKRFGGSKVHYSNAKTDRAIDGNSDYKSERFGHQERVQVKKEADLDEKESNTSYDNNDRESKTKYPKHQETAGYRTDSYRYNENYRHNQVKKGNCHTREEYCESREDAKRDQSLNRLMSNNYHHNRSLDSDQNYQMTSTQRCTGNTESDGSRTRSHERSHNRSHKKETNRYGDNY